MRIPLLTYHSLNVSGNDYITNDHVALAEDLALIQSLSVKVVPLSLVVGCVLNDEEMEPAKAVAITFDDGAHPDWHDIEHPTCGPQPGFYRILSDFARSHEVEQPLLHATSFVIASPDARDWLDKRCMIGRGWWTDDWWHDALESGLIGIENHSWDHRHPSLDPYKEMDEGFLAVADYDTADYQIRQAADYIDGFYGSSGCSLFAFPYGQASDYVAKEYLPNYQHEHRMKAAFTTEPKPVESGDDRWLLPRYVCGAHWRSPGELRALFRDVGW